MKLLAVSGGLDSVVMLDFLSAKVSQNELIVAHFNHGTRPSADEDEAFVENLAKKYHLPFYSKKAHLGSNVSEATARTARYDFLSCLAWSLSKTSNQRQMLFPVDVPLYTAHHLNDLAETVAINLHRGTGWRGLAPFDTENIVRPFLNAEMTKNDLRRYAASHHLPYREDPTNHTDDYLRNRIRQKTEQLSEQTLHDLSTLWKTQLKLKHEIAKTAKTLLPDNHYSRRLFLMTDKDVATELLRHALEDHDLRLTRPQIENFLCAIKIYPPEKSFNLPKNRLVTLHRTFFSL